ncbi:hypothetical protein I4U23_004327 [Adineta vaga]|nr:hypothetical protein I4U23_004327 [Adineta vaga]
MLRYRGVVVEAMLDSPHVASTFPADVGIGHSLKLTEHVARLQVTGLHTPAKSNDCDVPLDGSQPSVSQHLQTQRISFHRPKFCPHAVWNPDATTFASNDTIGLNPHNIFIDLNDTVYITILDLGIVQVWPVGSNNATRIISGNLDSPATSFVTINGDIYVDNGNNSEVDKWTLNATDGESVFTVPGQCMGLFIDMNNTIYCSMDKRQLVIAKSLDDDSALSRVVAGNGSMGLTSRTLSYPNGTSNHQPKFCSQAVWNPNATTFAPDGTIGLNPHHVFVDIYDTVYITILDLSVVQVWPVGSNNATRIISANLNLPATSFVTINGDIYVDNGNQGQVDKWTLNATDGESVFTVPGQCMGLFIDINNTIYCSMDLRHIVMAKSLDDNSNSSRIVAGNGSLESTPNCLNMPNDISFNQPKFCPDVFWNSNATTFLGNDTIDLKPNGIFIDTKNNVYMVSEYNNSINIWFENNINSTRTISTNFSAISDIFVTLNGDIYISYFYNGEIARWTLNATIDRIISVDTLPCTQIFIDLNNYLYCSMSDNHQVIKRPLDDDDDNSTAWIVIAGNTTAASASNTLYEPKGIYVDNNFNLYVADCIFILDEITTLTTTDSDELLFSTDDSSTQTINNITEEFQTSTEGQLSSTQSMSTSDAVETSTADEQYFSTEKTIDKTTEELQASTEEQFSTSESILTTDAIQTSTADEQYFSTGESSTDSINNTTEELQTSTEGQFSSTQSMSTDSTEQPVITTSDVIETSTYESLAQSIDHTTEELQTSTEEQLSSLQSTLTSNRIETSTTDVQYFSTDDSSTKSIDNTTEELQTSTEGQLSSLQSMSTYSTQGTLMTTTDTPETSTTNQELQNTSRKLSHEYLECFLSMITLIPNDTSFLTPAQYRRGDNIRIDLNINQNCTSLNSFSIQWIISNCTTSCDLQININHRLNITTNQLFIPPRTLSYGTYQFKLLLTMINSTTLIVSSSVYIAIIPSTIIVNLAQYGTSVITSSYENDLILDPGKYSIDPDSNLFDITNWNYTYYCLTDNTDHMIIDGTLIQLDEPNHPCFSNKSNNSKAWSYGLSDVPQSSVIIHAGSLLSNRTYRFLVNMIYRENSRIQANGYVSVNVENVQLPMIAVACVIHTMCSASLQYQYINPTTQIALFSVCIGNCTLLTNITWNIYQGSKNHSTNTVIWTSLNSFYDTNQVFGIHTGNFTITNHLFSQYTNISYWRFEVAYAFNRKISLGALDFVINQPPRYGSCSINPPNGTITTLFNISCSNWFDENGITDYSFYAYTTDSTQKIILGSTAIPNFQVRLPSSVSNISIVNIIVTIQDGLNAVTQVELEPVIVYLDWIEINTWMNHIEYSSLMLELFANRDPNILAQIITLISEFFNEMNEKQTEIAMRNGIPLATISISSLNTIYQSISSITLNTSSALEIYTNYINQDSTIRDYLITYITNLSITNLQSILLQSSTLSQLTNTPNELTRTTSILASTKCYQLSTELQSMADQISSEDLQTAAQSIVQCAANVYTAINEPLQDRGIILDLDFNRANIFPDDYDTDLESIWSNSKLFANGNDFSWNTIQQGRNTYYQKQTANVINNQWTDIVASLTAAFQVHLNIEQKFILNTTSIFFSLEKLLIQSLPNKLIQLSGNGQIKLPENFNLIPNSTDIVLLRSIMLPLAPLVSLSLIDMNNNEMFLTTNMNNSIEYRIPRDINGMSSSINLQNVTSMKNFNRSFNLHYINLTRENNLSISIHFEMYPMDINLAYIFIYNFDDIPQMNHFENWALFCPLNLVNESLYTYFIDNEDVSNHQSLIFGLRELDSHEIETLCSNNSHSLESINLNNSWNFSSNYKLRLYTSGCYYLDSNNNWLSDGLVLGSLTNLVQTQCFSTRSGTFAGALHILPSPINWNYVFAHAKFSQNKTIYITITIVLTIYFVLIIYARSHDKYDIKQLGVSILATKAKMNDYSYQILVFTGFRAHSNTESKVHFVLIGENDRTNIRTFSSSHRKIFQCGGIDSFVITVPKPLGSLEYLHIWHDNSGKDTLASWFLKYIIVRDLQTMEHYHFICQRWLAVEHDDGAIERLLTVASESEKENYSNILSKKVYENVSDRHLCIELGDIQVQKWLTSILTGFISSACITQPLQILIMTICTIIYSRGKGKHPVSMDDHCLNDTEEYIHTIEDQSLSYTKIDRLNKTEVATARRQRFRQIRIRAIIEEIFSYVFYLGTIYFIAYYNYNTNVFFQVSHLQHFFLNPNSPTHDYTKITTINEYWLWLENSFVENIRAQQWYNGAPPRNLSGFIDDKSNRLIGWATMRQLRIKAGLYHTYSIYFEELANSLYLDLCHIPSSVYQSLNLTCDVGYSYSNEEQRSFGPKWTDLILKNYSSSIINAFKYQSSQKLDTYTYIGNHETYNSGGYVYEFRGRLSELRTNLSLLRQLKWIDQYTRAILIQMSLYNPNIQTFTSVTFLLELLPVGGIFPSSRFEPLHIQDLTSVIYLIFIGIHISLLIYHMIKEFQEIHHLKFRYFCQIWSLMNISIIIFSWVGISIYVWRYFEIKRITNLFRDTNGYAYVNLQFLAYINDVFHFILGFCCFFGTIKLLHLCRFSSRLSVFNDTLYNAKSDLIQFMIMFVMIFISFMILFYELFLTKILSCSSLLHTSIMLFEMILLKFNVEDLYQADKILGPISKLTQNEDQEAFDYMINKCLCWIGLMKSDELDYQEQNKSMELHYYDTFEYFPIVTDRLMEILYRIR